MKTESWILLLYLLPNFFLLVKISSSFHVGRCRKNYVGRIKSMSRWDVDQSGFFFMMNREKVMNMISTLSEERQITEKFILDDDEDDDDDDDGTNYKNKLNNLMKRKNNIESKDELQWNVHTEVQYSVTTTTTSLNTKREGKMKPKQVTKKRSRGRRRSGEHLSYDSALEALRAYYKIHGDLAIPRRYVVPDSEEYPKEWHGVDISSTVYEMKWWKTHIKSHPSRVTELNSINFIWERLQTEFNLIIQALITYSSMHDGSTIVPNSFVVPHGDDRWPAATWGMALGICVNKMRNRNDYIRGEYAGTRRAQLDGLGFVWDVGDLAFRKVYKAIGHYAWLEKNGGLEDGRTGGNQGHDNKTKTKKTKSSSNFKKTLRIPSTFVVPTGRENGWPEDLWDYPLGAKCTAIRQKQLYVKKYPERRRALEELGFRWNGNATLGWLAVVHAAAIYSKLHGRKLDVPVSFVVPAAPDVTYGKQGGTGGSMEEEMDGGAWPWPEQLWGLPLGQRLKDVRLKGAYLKGKNAESRKAQLKALGFVWVPKLGRRRKK